MFIHDIKLMQDGQEVIIRRGLGLWLCTFNQTTGAHRKALYASNVNGLFEFLPRPTHGEPMSVQGPMPVFHCKSNNQMIEDRTEVVYDFSGKNNKTEGNVDFPAHSPYIFSSLVRATTDDFIMHIILDESIDFAIEVKDILISTLKFGSNS